MAEVVQKSINAHISDLFFNLDHSEAKITGPDGTFQGWDKEKMVSQARWFRDAIDVIMFQEPPSVGAILDDFYGRV